MTAKSYLQAGNSDFLILHELPGSDFVKGLSISNMIESNSLVNGYE